MLKDLVFGLFEGATYGMLAVGLVLVYKGTRVFNFAQGEFGTIGAFLVYWMFSVHHMNYALAVLISLVAVVGIGLVVERLLPPSPGNRSSSSVPPSRRSSSCWWACWPRWRWR